MSIEVETVKIFLTFLLAHQVFSVNQELIRQLRENCVRDIQVYFDEERIKDQADIAMANYNEFLPVNKLNTSSMGYYKSFRNFLRPGVILTPEQFLGPQPADGSLYWLQFLYGTDKIQIVQTAFYTFRSDDFLKKENVYMISLYELREQNPDFTVPYRSNHCREWMKYFFGSSVLQSYFAVYYKLQVIVSQNQVPGHVHLQDVIQDYHIPLENLHDVSRYFWHIASYYDVETNGFPGLRMYCSHAHPLDVQ